MKELIFDLQRFGDPVVTIAFKLGEGNKVIGYIVTTPEVGEPTTGEDLFEISGLKSGLTDTAGFTGEISGTTYTATVPDGALDTKEEVTIAAINTGDTNIYALDYDGAKKETDPAWSITGKIGKCTKAEYYAVEGDNKKIVYHAPQDLVQITLDKIGVTADLKNYLEVAEPSADPATPSTITVKSAQDGTNLEAGFTVDATKYNYTIEFKAQDSVVKNPETSNVELYLYNATQGKVQVKGDWSEGYYLVEDTATKKNTTIKYSAAKTDQVLATITGLVKNKLETPTTTPAAPPEEEPPGNETSNAESNEGGGTTPSLITALNADGETALTLNGTEITLNKGALSTYNITIANGKAPDGTTVNEYTIVLNPAADSGIKKAKEEIVDSKLTFGAPDAEDIWELKNTTATYKNVIPAYYTRSDDNTEITYTAQKDNTTYGVIKGLSSTAELVVYEEGDKSKIGVVTTTPGQDDAEDTVSTEVGIIPTADNGVYTFELQENVLPITNGKVTLSETSSDKSKLALAAGITAQTVKYVEGSDAVPAQGTAGEDGYVPAQAAVEASPKWSVSAGTATLSAKLNNGYILSDDKTIQSYAAQNSADLVTITGLDPEVTAGNNDIGTYITVEGYNASATKDDGNNLAGKDDTDTAGTGDADGKITITLKKAALTGKDVKITNKNDSFTYELALDNDALKASEQGSGEIPATKNIWTVNGTTAVYKQVVPEHWTIETVDNIKYIKHYKQSDVQTYATLKGLKDGVVVSEDKTQLGFNAPVGTAQNPPTQFVEAVTIDEGTITLNALALGGTNVTLVQGDAKDDKGKAITYKLAIDTDSKDKALSYTTAGENPQTVEGTAVLKVATPDTEHKWWEVANNTATLHHATQAGYKVESDTLIKHYAEVADSTIATITGLSNDVKALKEDGTAVGTGTKTDGVKLGIAGQAANDGKAVIAHNTVVAYKTEAGHTAEVQTWNEGGAAEGDDKQVITLTNAMLNKGKVALKDNNLKDGDAFALALSDDGSDDPATEAEPSNKWAVGGSAQATTLTYQSYDKGYYKLDDDKVAIAYTKDTSPQKLFTITVNGAKTIAENPEDRVDRVITSYTFDDANPAVMKYDDNAFLTVNDDQTITVNNAAVSTAADNNIVFKYNDEAYKDYKFTEVEKGETSNMVTWGTPTWAVTTGSGIATLSKTPDTNKEGYELSSDSQTLTYRSTTKNLLTLSGLDTGVDALTNTQVEYDEDTKTVTILTDKILTNTKVTLKSEDKDVKYTLAVDETEIRTVGKDGYSWSAVSTPGTISVKSVTRDFYTLSKDSDTLVYNKEVPKADGTLFTISGLNATAIPNTFTDKDGDNALNAIAATSGSDLATLYTSKKISAGAEFLTFDPVKKTVSIENAAVLPTTKDDVVTLKGTDWSFDSNSITEPSFSGSGSWSIDANNNVVLTIPEANVTAGYKLSDKGQKLTYITGDQIFLKISGLNVPADDSKGERTALLNNLANAFDGDHTVTLPQSVLGTASKIKLTPGNNYKEDTFNLALEDDVWQKENTPGFSWTVTEGESGTKNLTFKSLTRAYFEQIDNTTYTYHKDANMTTLFTLNGLQVQETSDKTSDNLTDAQTADKDTDPILTYNNTDLVTVDTATHKITLSDTILPSGVNKNGKEVTLKSNDYTFATDTDLTTPVYGNGAWTQVDSNGVSTLNFKATTAGYVVEDKAIKYVGQQEQEENKAAQDIKHPFLQVSGLTEGVTPDINTTAVFDDTASTVTLTKDVLNDTKVSIKALDGNSYTLKLDSEVLQEAKAGYSWTVTPGATATEQTATVVAKAVTQAYYASDTSNTFFTYKKEVPTSTLFTLTGLKNVEYDTTNNKKLEDLSSDKDGDNILGNDLISFDEAKSEVTIATSALPTTNDATVTIDSKSVYHFANDFTAPVYVYNANNDWDVGKDNNDKLTGTATLKNTPQSAGYEMTTDKKLTRIAAASRNLTTLSGLNITGQTESTLKNLLKGVEVSIDDKTIKLPKSLLEGTKKITAEKGTGYKLSVDDTEVQLGKKEVETDVWQLVDVTPQGGGTATKTAYRRTVYPEYYTIDKTATEADTITYHSAVKRADLFGISGLKDGIEVNDDGDIVENGKTTSLVSMYKDSADTKTTIVSISTDALPATGTVSFTGKGTDNYKFDLADGAATLGAKTWKYDPAKGEITVKGTYTAGGSIVADDGKSIKTVAEGAEETLATITGLKTALTFTSEDPENKFTLSATEVAKYFEFDADAKTITFKDDTFFPGSNGTIKISDTDNFFNYKVALDSEINTNKTKAGTKWDVSADGATIKYMNITEAAYTTAADGKSIAVQAQKTGTAATTITGLTFKANDTTLYEEATGTEKNTLSLVPTAAGKTANKPKIEDAISVDVDKKTVTIKQGILPITDQAEVKATSSYKLVLDPSDDTIPKEVSYSNYTLAQKDKNDDKATEVTVKAKAAAYYSGDGTGTITYTPEKTDELLATIKGVATVETAITAANNIASASTSLGNGIYVDTDEKTITLKNAALTAGQDASIETNHGYKLALYDEQNKEAADQWNVTAGKATYTNTTPQYFEVQNNGAKIKSIAPKDNKTYFTIEGLKSSELAVYKTSTDESVIVATGQTNAIVSFDGNDTVTLALAALPGTENDKITIKKGAGGTGTYKLAFAENAAETTFKQDGTTVDVLGLAKEGAKAVTNSGNKVVYQATIGKGYVLSDSGTEITVANGKGTKDYFSITGLKTTGFTSPNNIATYVTVDDNTNIVTIHPEALNNTKVSISTDADYTLALHDDVPTSKEAENYITFSNGTLSLKNHTPAHYELNDKGEITYTGAKDEKTLATITGFNANADAFKNGPVTEDSLKDKISIDWDAKEITIADTTVLGESNVAVGTGKGTYTLKFDDVNDESPTNEWTVSNGTATLKSVPSKDTYKLSDKGDTIVYTAKETKTELLKITGLNTDTKAESGEGTGNEGITTENSIEGISLAKVAASGDETKDTLIVTLNNEDLFADKNVSITGSNNYTAKLKLGDQAPTDSEGSSAWEYIKSGDNYTLDYKKTVPVYYDLDSTGTTARYHAETDNTKYISISGKGSAFNSNVTGKIDTYLDAKTDTAKKTAKTAADTALADYVTLTAGTAATDDTPAVAPKITFKTTENNNNNYYLLAKTDGNSVTISTPKVNNETYEVAFGTGAEVAVKADSYATWSISGNSLILSNGFTEGYKLSGTKLSYEAEDNTGDKIITINGLDLTKAKAAATYLTEAEKSAAETKAKNAALAAINEDLGITPALTVAPTEPAALEEGATAEQKTAYEKNLKIYNAYTAALKTATEKEELNTYIGNNLTVATATGEDAETYAKTLTIKKDLLGTSNISVTKNGTDAYKLVIDSSDSTIITDSDTAKNSADNAWSFSGGTATYRMTTPKYYLYDETKNQILYKKANEGDIATQVKGLATTYKNYSSTTSIENSTATTNYYTDTTVVQVQDGVIGTVTTRTTRTLVEDITKDVAGNETERKTESDKTETAAPGTFVPGLSLEGDTITLSKNVLGTSAVTVTNDYKLAVDSGVTEPAEDAPKWTGTLGGTSAVYKADVSAGYTLSEDGKKITYSAAKNGATLLTVSGIKIPTTIESNGNTITSASDSDTRNTAINTWVGANVTIGTESDADAEGKIPVTLKAAALNEKNVTVKSGTTTKYKLALDSTGIATEAVPTKAWNGWNYQSFDEGYYETVEKDGSIKYHKAGKATTVATVKGLKGKYDESMGTETTLKISAAHLGTSNVSVTGSEADTIKFELDGDVAQQTTEGTKWIVSGTTATKKDGNSAYYTLEGDNVIKYNKETEVKNIYATITGLKAGAQISSDTNGVVTLDKNSLGTTKVTIANGKNADKDYTLMLDTTTGNQVSNPTFTQLENEHWQAKGVNATLKGNIDAGYDLSADKKSVLYTASAKGKALATFTFASTDTITADLSGKVIDLKDVGTNDKITLKTNPYALTVKVSDTDFDGSSGTKVTLVGSSAADTFDISGKQYINVSGGAGDDVVNLGTAKKGVSIGGGAGNDSIYGTGDTDLIILGDAGNDTISINGNAEKVNGGAGNDYLSVANAVNVLGDAGNDTINVTGTVSVLSAGAGNDSVKVASAGAIDIKGDAGNDHIEITGTANGTTIHGGAGNDTIKAVNTGNTAVSVVGDAGNDVIEFKGNGTIYGGAGNDSIDVNGGTVTFFYASGDGSDSVTGWSSDDKFVLKSGKIADKKASIGGANNEDLILTIGSGKVTLFGAASTVNETKQWTYYSSDTSIEKSILVVGGDTADASDIASDINSLIYEDNNLVTPNDISDLVSTNSITEYHVGNYDLTTPNQILPDSDNISYGNQQKKNNK